MYFEANLHKNSSFRFLKAIMSTQASNKVIVAVPDNLITFSSPFFGPPLLYQIDGIFDPETDLDFVFSPGNK